MLASLWSKFVAEPIPFPESNKTYKAPEGHPEVLDLPTYQGGGLILSKWKLTKPEIEEVMRTGVVWIWVMGQGMPPVSISVGDPFKQQQDKQ